MIITLSIIIPQLSLISIPYMIYQAAIKPIGKINVSIHDAETYQERKEEIDSDEVDIKRSYNTIHAHYRL